MAELTRVNGGAFGVVNHDRSLDGSGAISAAELVVANGPRVDFFKVIVTDASGNAVDIRNELDELEAVERILQTVQTKGKVEMYQVEGDTSGQISLCVFPTDAWTASTLQTAIRDLGTTVGANDTDVSATVVTNDGFKLS